MQQKQPDLPFWTMEELEAASSVENLIVDAGYTVPVAKWQLPLSLESADANVGIKFNYYSVNVLDKYRSYPLSQHCDIGYDNDNKLHYIRFLHAERGTDSLVPFRLANDTVIVKVTDTISIPPRQIPHWEKYKQ
jgi:hypothetical protein